MTSSGSELHIFFLPFPTPGHIIPMFELSLLISARGVRSTVITTPSNAELLLPFLSNSNAHNIRLLTIPFSSQTSPENLTSLPTPEITPEFSAALRGLEPHFESLVVAHRPDCVISDIHYPWTTALAERHRIPRIVFHGTSYFAFTVMTVITVLRLHNSVSGPDEPFVIPGFPHQIKMTISQLPSETTSPSDSKNELSSSLENSHGMVMNTFYELEPAYADSSKKANFIRSWHVGPFFLSRRRSIDLFGVGDTQSEVFRWLDGHKASSVLYVCFGSLPRFTADQSREIKAGLEAAKRPFVWVVREHIAAHGNVDIKGSIGLVIKGWAPQRAILDHEAVGGFLTHCGWNSCLEGIAAGVPVVSWPLFSDQHCNERLLVDVLGLGVGVGSTVNSFREEERTVVAAERVAKAVEEVMGGGEEGEERRRKAREMKEAAEKAVGDGGSSDLELGRMIEGLLALKCGGEKDVEVDGVNVA